MKAAIALLATVFLLQTTAVDPPPRQDALVQANNALGLRLLQQIEERQAPTENSFISPLSLSLALAMAYNGAAGRTADAMRDVIGVDGLSLDQVNAGLLELSDGLMQLDSAVDFLPANSVWYRRGFAVKPGFLDANRRYFHAEVAGLDFDDPAAAATINRWVNEKTKGLIDKIFAPPLSDSTLLLLVDAIYFRGEWTAPFNTYLTRPRRFTRADGRQLELPMMTYSYTARVGHYADDSLQAVDLGYGSGAFSMTILLPDVMSSMRSLVASLTPARWQEIMAGLERTDMKVVMPKFRLEYELDMKETMEALGMGVAFQPGGADFTGIADPPPRFYISRFKHKTFVDVDELGTRATAATGIELVPTSLPPTMVVDRPFLVAIRARESGTVLFIGIVNDPS